MSQFFLQIGGKLIVSPFFVIFLMLFDFCFSFSFSFSNYDSLFSYIILCILFLSFCYFLSSLFDDDLGIGVDWVLVGWRLFACFRGGLEDGNLGILENVINRSYYFLLFISSIEFDIWLVRPQSKSDTSTRSCTSTVSTVSTESTPI